MLTIEDLNRIINLPTTSLNINAKKVQDVLKFREEVLPFVDNLNLFTVDFINGISDILSYWYMLQKNPWLKDKCVIGVMGTYSAGKSTILKRLLDVDLPTDVNPTTAIPTYISYGEDDKHYLVDNDGNLKLIPKDLEGRLSHEETKGFNLRKIISHTVLYKQLDVLKKISFLDTPGISADNEYDYETTADAARKCDVVLWVVRANAGAITEFELEFIKKYLSNKKLYIILSHAERNPNPEKIMQTVLGQISDAGVQTQGFFYFGLRSTPKINIEDQLNNIAKAFNKEIKDFKAFHPQEQLNRYLSFVQSHIEDKIKESSDEKQKIEKICREYECHIEKVKSSLSNNTNSLARSIEKIQSTINERCRGVLMCTGGAYRELVAYYNSMVECYNNLASSISQLDVDQLIIYGKAVSYLSRLSDSVDEYVSSRNTCVKLIADSKNLLK